MAVGINVVKEDIENLMVQVQLTGLTAGTKYDVYRLQVRYLGDDDNDVPQYDRDLPDRRAFWSAVAHRVGWTAPAATATFRDFECPRRPTQYFVVLTSAIAPYEYNWENGDYPLSRGVLASQVIHWNRDLDLYEHGGPDEVGHLLIRSTQDLAKYVSLCVVDIPDFRYQARGTELAVMGRQYPVYIADTREARRGSVTVKVDTLGQYDDLRSIVFPASGRIRPVIFNTMHDPTMLLDDLRCVPLDISVEPITQRDADLRYVHLDFVEVDPTEPLVARSGDNDTLVNAPQANFSISDHSPRRDQWITLTDTSTGQYDSWDWSIERGSNNRPSKYFTQGPHRIRWSSRGEKTIKLRVYGSGAGAHVRSKTITVH